MFLVTPNVWVKRRRSRPLERRVGRHRRWKSEARHERHRPRCRAAPYFEVRAGLLPLALPFWKFRAFWPKTEVGRAVTCMLSVCTCVTAERNPKALNILLDRPSCVVNFGAVMHRSFLACEILLLASAPLVRGPP